MKWNLLTRKLTVLLLVVHMTGCLTPEESITETTETAGVPTNGQADFTVNPGDENTSQNTDDGTALNPDADNGTVGTGDINTPNTPDRGLSLTINNGATTTNSMTLDLSIGTSFYFYQMRIGQTRDCSDGTWVRSASNATAQVTTKNAVQVVSVIFRDFDDARSECIVKTIIHDDIGPDIVIKKYPTATLEEGSTTEIIAEVTDISGLESVTCSINGVTKACRGGVNTIQLSPMPVGNYTFTINARDNTGLTSSKSVSWSVVSSIKQVTQTVKVGNERKFDILVVVDNSGSMSYEQKNMAQRVNNMLAILRGLDYQIGVTTTDPRSSVAWGDGKLLPIKNTSKFWIDSSMDESSAQLNLGLTIQRSEVGSATEQGILTTYRTLERTIAGQNTGFIRPDAKLAIILISDEDESANTNRNDPENLMRLVSTNWDNKTFAFHSIITKPGDSSCLKGEGASEGHRYAKLSKLTGGIIGSVCESDYAAQVSGIATDIRNMLKNITLTCKPVDGTPISIKKDGVTLAETPVLDGLTLKFNEPLSIGTYEINYTCLK